MIPFRSSEEMLNAHEQMFGQAGRQAAEIVLRWAGTLFAAPLETLNIRVVLAPVELNRHTGHCAGGEGQAAFILGNRHMVKLAEGTLVLRQNFQVFEDFIVHELTHHRQKQLLAEHAESDPEWGKSRGGHHRDRGWYAAIAEAAPKYLGVQFPEASWPTRPRPRGGSQLSEVLASHWPDSFRILAKFDDPRLPKAASAGA